MARFNEILAGRYNRYLQKLFQLKGGPPAAQLASEVMPVFPFFSGAEHRYLEGWNRYWVVMLPAAVAAQTGKVHFRNPRSNNLIAVIEKLTMVGVGTSQFFFSVQHNDAGVNLANIVNGNNLDFRTASNSSLVCSSTTDATTDLPILTYIVQCQNASQEFVICEDQEITLLPGDTLRVRDGTANEGPAISAIWRERSLEESELK